MSNRVFVALASIVMTIGAGAMAAERWFGAFAAYPQARELCNEHVTGNGMNITWRSYATHDALDKVVKFYESDQKHAPTVDEKTGERKFVAASDADTILSIYTPAAATAAKVPTCGNGATKSGESSLIIVFKAARAR
jgi:hypothetical protein